MVGCHLHIFNKRGKPKAGHLQISKGMKAYSKRKTIKARQLQRSCQKHVTKSKLVGLIRTQVEKRIEAYHFTTFQS